MLVNPNFDDIPANYGDREDIYAQYLDEQLQKSHFRFRCEQLEAENALLKEELERIRIESDGRYFSKYDTPHDKSDIGA